MANNELPLDGLSDEEVDKILDSLYSLEEWPPIDGEAYLIETPHCPAQTA